MENTDEDFNDDDDFNDDEDSDEPDYTDKIFIQICRDGTNYSIKNGNGATVIDCMDNYLMSQIMSNDFSDMTEFEIQENVCYDINDETMINSIRMSKPLSFFSNRDELLKMYYINDDYSTLSYMAKLADLFFTSENYDGIGGRELDGQCYVFHGNPTGYGDEEDQYDILQDFFIGIGTLSDPVYDMGETMYRINFNHNPDPCIVGIRSAILKGDELRLYNENARKFEEEHKDDNICNEMMDEDDEV